MSEKLALMFQSITSPGKISIDFFHQKKVAFYECVPFLDNCDAFQYFYDGDITEAAKYLESIGFEDVEILGHKPYSRMQECLTLKRK